MGLSTPIGQSPWRDRFKWGSSFVFWFSMDHDSDEVQNVVAAEGGIVDKWLGEIWVDLHGLLSGLGEKRIQVMFFYVLFLTSGPWAITYIHEDRTQLRHPLTGG